MLLEVAKEMGEEEKTTIIDLSPEEMAKRLFGREVVVLDISKRITNDGKTVHGWRIEFVEKNKGSV